MVKAQNKVAKKSVKKSKKTNALGVSTQDVRIFRWVAATGAVAGLSLFASLLVAALSTNPASWFSENTFWYVSLSLLVLYAIFLSGFLILGKFRTWKVILPLVTALLFLVITAYKPGTGLIDKFFSGWTLQVGEQTWLGLASLVHFASYFLLVATGFALLQVLLKRQSHSVVATGVLLVTFLVSLLLVFV